MSLVDRQPNSGNIALEKEKNLSHPHWWRKITLLTLLSSMGFTFPLKAMAQEDVVTASIPIPVSPPEIQDQNSIEQSTTEKYCRSKKQPAITKHCFKRFRGSMTPTASAGSFISAHSSICCR